MNGVRVWELACFGGQGLRVAFSDLKIPVCQLRGICQLEMAQKKMLCREYFTGLIQAAGAGRNIVGEFDLFRMAIACHGNGDCVRANVWNVKLLIQTLLVAIHAEACKIDPSVWRLLDASKKSGG